jgi:dienelactone hydrolase
VADRIGLQGWSNGGSAAISSMAVEADSVAKPTPETGFSAALVFYPACGLKGQFETKAFIPYAPTVVFHGTADEEVSYKRCASLVKKSRDSGGDVEIKLYEGATHSFDSPARSRQKVDANSSATVDSLERSIAFFGRYLGGHDAP